MRGRKYTSQNREKYGTLERNQTAAERAAENKSEKNIRGMKMDGKNREEQENGAKVRDLEEYKAENRKRKRRRRINVGILAGAILAAGIGTGVWIQLRTFQGYDTVQATETEDTDTYMFQKSGNKIVRYGIDGIELRDRKNQTLWSDHYTMENPQMISCGDAIAIYDKNGTKIVVYDADGKAGEITASYPIVKASVAGQGDVAAILENNGLLNQLFRKIGLIALYNNIFGTDISFFRMINTQGAVVLGMVYNYLPFMILPIYSVIIKLDHSLLEAARDLGANSLTVFRKVVLPLSLPGVLSGITMVFVPSVSTFAISRMLGGGTELLLGDLIERQFLGGAYNPQLGAAISLVMMLVVVVCMLVMNRFGEGEEQAVML